MRASPSKHVMTWRFKFKFKDKLQKYFKAFQSDQLVLKDNAPINRNTKTNIDIILRTKTILNCFKELECVHLHKYKDKEIQRQRNTKTNYKPQKWLKVLERAQLIQDNAPVNFLNRDCKPCRLVAWLHMVSYIVSNIATGLLSNIITFITR